MRTLPLILLSLAPALWGQGPEFDALDALKKNPTDHEAISALVGKYDERAIESLRASFDLVASPDDKTTIAFSLVDDGVRDSKYFDYLAARARTAIETDAPYALARDAKGEAIRGQISPAFSDWCRKRGIEINQCLADNLDTDPRAVAQLAMLGDQRSADLLTQGLRSSNPIIFITCAAGLGVLGKTEALPAIALRLAELSPNDAAAAALMLGDFNDAAAEALMDRYIPDKEMRAQARMGSIYSTLAKRRNKRGIR